MTRLPIESSESMNTPKFGLEDTESMNGTS